MFGLKYVGQESRNICVKRVKYIKTYNDAKRDALKTPCSIPQHPSSFVLNQGALANVTAAYYRGVEGSFLGNRGNKAQVLHYLKATGMRLGMLVNLDCYPNASCVRIVL